MKSFCPFDGAAKYEMPGQLSSDCSFYYHHDHRWCGVQPHQSWVYGLMQTGHLSCIGCNTYHMPTGSDQGVPGDALVSSIYQLSSDLAAAVSTCRPYQPGISRTFYWMLLSFVCLYNCDCISVGLSSGPQSLPLYHLLVNGCRVELPPVKG